MRMRVCAGKSPRLCLRVILCRRDLTGLVPCLFGLVFLLGLYRVEKAMYMSGFHILFGGEKPFRRRLVCPTSPGCKSLLPTVNCA